MAKCPDTRQLERLANGTLAAEDAAGVNRHVAECGRCARTLGALQGGRTLPESLKATVAHEEDPHLNVDEDARKIFEAAWEAVGGNGTPPEIDHHLPPADAETYAATVEELILIDMEYRHRDWSGGQATGPPIDVGGYLRRFPALDVPATRDRLQREQTLLRTRYRAAHREFPDVPSYEILSELGRGGMGVVYKARQMNLNRLVALKMLPASRPLAAVEFVRFQIEAEALASLQHPNIVQIHEVGERGGVPFLALELVEGGDLADQLGNKPGPFDQSARLIETLSRAMHVAHLRGIVHRDLKPGNVLMTRDGVPKISDFGLAKKLEAKGNSVTQTGVILGTPAYMAPEQAEGEIHAIGPATDVYALGAMLYEMLTCRPPLEGTSLWETVEMVRSVEPTAPRRLRPDVPRDLEVICLKCLEKAPAKRYPSALDLADDLARYLADEPILARPATTAERLRKWMRRHPTAAALFGAVTVATVAIVSLSVWSYVSLGIAYRRAEERSKLAREVVDDMYTRVAQEWLSDEPHRDPLQLEFLEKAAHLYEEFAKESGNDPARRRDVARASFRLGQIHRRLQRYDQADASFAKAIAIQEGLRDPNSDPAVVRDLAESYNWRGEAARERSRFAAAESDYRRAIALFESIPGGLEGAAQSRYNLGIVMMETGKLPDAEKEFDQAIQILMRGDAARPDRLQKLAHCYINRGVLHWNLGQFAKAEADDRAAIDFLTGLRQKSSRVDYKLDLALTRQNLGNVAIAQAKEAAKTSPDDRDRYLFVSRGELTEAAALLRGLVADFPQRPIYRKKLANVSNSLASFEAMTGDFAAAQKNWLIAVDLFERLADEHKDIPDYSVFLGAALGNLGWLAAEKKDWPEARDRLNKAVERLEAALAKNPGNPEARAALRDQYQNLAEAAVHLGDHAAAYRSAKSLADVFPDRPQDSYNAACFAARCIPLARATDAEKIYANGALAFLRRARQAKLKVDRLANEAEIFAPLTDNQEFIELRKTLGQNP